MPFQVYKSMILLYVAAHLIVPMGCSSISSKSSYLRPNLLLIFGAGETVLRGGQAAEHMRLRSQHGLSSLLAL